MKPEFKELQIKQLERNLLAFVRARDIVRPRRGWVHAIRTALGMSASTLSKRLGASRQLVVQQEQAEVDDRITLKSLRTLANALDCDLVYALVPRTKNLAAMMVSGDLEKAVRNVNRVEHSMALEDQAVGHLTEAIKDEAKRLGEGR